MPNYKHMYFALHNEIIRTITRLQRELDDVKEYYESEPPIDLREIENLNKTETKPE